MTGPDDRKIVEAQIGRPPRARPDVVFRCHLGLPVVLRMPPVLDDGTPFPTLYWLTCPLAARRVGRLESSGGVKRMEAKAASDEGFRSALQSANATYSAERDSLLPAGAAPAPSGGVGGSTEGVKCLHAHYAHTKAGGENPVGEIVRDWIEPLDCVEPCVDDDGRNPRWSSLP